MIESLAETIRVACHAEVLARKPGNVHPQASFHDLTVHDFLVAGELVAPILSRSASLGIGRAVFEAVSATRERVATNANLGICLLVAPCAAAASRGGDFRTALEAVLSQLTIDDARWAYRAIRAAMPGGLGVTADQDVADEPTVSLLAAMQLAADRDDVARQYVSTFQDVMEIGVPALRAFRPHGPETAIVGAHLSLMAARPDSLIARKCGHEIAAASARRAAEVLDSGWPDQAGRSKEKDLDTWLRDDGHRQNPGTTADLVAATILVGLQQHVLSPQDVTSWVAGVRDRLNEVTAS